MRRTLVALAVLVLLAPAAAQARFVLIDANFDARTAGEGLERRGSLFGEPVPGPHDYGTEVIHDEGVTGRSLRIPDTGADRNDRVHYTFRDLVPVDGRLFVNCRVLPETIGSYALYLRGASFASELFFMLQFAPDGTVSWWDQDDAPTQVGTYVPGGWMELEAVIDLDDGLYDLSVNGVPLLTDETYGGVFGAVSLVMGNAPDTDATGAVRVDDLFVTWRPGTAHTLLAADFDDKPLNQPIGTGGPAVGEPTSVASAIEAVVRQDGFATPSLTITDQDDFSGGSARFEFLDDAEVWTGDVSLRFRARFEDLEDHTITIKENGTATRTFLALNGNASGTFSLYDEADLPPYDFVPYAAATPYRFEVAHVGAFGLLYLWIDEELVVYRRQHGITDHGPGSIRFGQEHDADQDGAFTVDDIAVHTLPSVTDVAGTAAPPRLAAAAAPNPFNPATVIRFELPARGRATVDVVDLRGRLVSRLLDGERSAGVQTIAWRGVDATGRTVPSGAYLAVIRAAGVREVVPLTLLE